jgi:hypothetical protein
MLEHLQRIIARLRDLGFFLPTRPPENPDVGVRQPRSGRRPGGTTAAAVAEPDEPAPATRAIGMNRRA